MKYPFAIAIAVLMAMEWEGPSWAKPLQGQASQLALPAREPTATVGQTNERLTTLANQINQNTQNNPQEQPSDALESIAEDLDIQLPENPVIIESMGDYGIGIQF